MDANPAAPGRKSKQRGRRDASAPSAKAVAEGVEAASQDAAGAAATFEEPYVPAATLERLRRAAALGMALPAEPTRGR